MIGVEKIVDLEFQYLEMQDDPRFMDQWESYLLPWGSSNGT